MPKEKGSSFFMTQCIFALAPTWLRDAACTQLRTIFQANLTSFQGMLQNLQYHMHTV